jgi:hypothetical protein
LVEKLQFKLEALCALLHVEYMKALSPMYSLDANYSMHPIGGELPTPLCTKISPDKYDGEDKFRSIVAVEDDEYISCNLHKR